MLTLPVLLAQEPAKPQPAEPRPQSGEQASPATQATPPAQTNAQTPTQPAPVTPLPSSGSPPLVLSASEQGPTATSITEEELRQQLQGKMFYLRGGYLDNTLRFDEQGRLNGSSPQASYTLSLVEIQRVRLEKHRLQLEGIRYGLHFLGALPTQDQTAAVDKVRLTSKKKPLVIVIDREQVAKAKKEKESKADRKRGPQTPASATQAAASAAIQQPPEIDAARHGAAVTTSEAQADRTLVQALDRIFAAGIDEGMIAALPDYWKLFYKSVEERRDYKPADPAVLRQTDVDQKAKLISVFEPPSNEFAQNNGVAGIAMYHVLVGADGKPAEIAVGRPIGFGLDENAVKSIREAKFQPAIKGGHPVPVVLDLLVQFRIYSKRTAEASNQPAPAPVPAQPNTSALPGPYSVSQPQSTAQRQ